MAGLAGGEIPVVVCASIAEEARARELGADHCLLHPFTYDGFLAALTGAKGESGLRRKERADRTP